MQMLYIARYAYISYICPVYNVLCVATLYIRTYISGIYICMYIAGVVQQCNGTNQGTLWAHISRGFWGHALPHKKIQNFMGALRCFLVHSELEWSMLKAVTQLQVQCMLKLILLPKKVRLQESLTMTVVELVAQWPDLLHTSAY